ncbi:hypothetical protein SPI_07714 [Niveomyces insectorum RCEF 264]|uniref:Uncharacterized protein n=1 Tax=Niveomyces insectorum RCEF 264 TaxID=1081102 RepID=A0A167PIY0_9HYPO|nr:hypothetical protein SPI_07714 [Niveomyces insectorum RCEF 264]
MRGLYRAGLLLVPALVRGAGAVASEGNTPSAFITIELPQSEVGSDYSFLSFRVDVLESQQACGSPNATINGTRLPADSRWSLPVPVRPGEPVASVVDRNDADGSRADGEDDGDDDTARRDVAFVRWTADCVSWGGEAREQRMELHVVSMQTGTETEAGDDTDTTANRQARPFAAPAVTVRFRQTAPVRIIDVEGAANVFYFDGTANDNVGDDGNDHTAELAAWQNSLLLLQHHVAVLQHDLALRTQYVRDRFGGAGLPGSNLPLSVSDRPCGGNAVTSWIGSVFHKIASAAHSLYDDGDAHGSSGGDEPDPAGPPEWLAPMCLAHFGHNRKPFVAPPSLPPPPPPFLLHCPSSLTPASPEDEPLVDVGADNDGGYDVDAASNTANADNAGDAAVVWTADHTDADSQAPPSAMGGGGVRGRPMRGYGPDGFAVRTGWADHRGSVRFRQSSHDGLGTFGRAPIAKMLALFGLLLVVFIFVRRWHLSRRHRFQGRFDGHAHGSDSFRRGLRSSVRDNVHAWVARLRTHIAAARHDRHARRLAYRERHAQRRAAVRAFVRRVRRFLVSGNGEKTPSPTPRRAATPILPVAAPDRPTAAPAYGHIEVDIARTGTPAPPPSRPLSRSSRSSFEREIAEFRAVADVVGQMVAAEEGRAAISQAAAARREEEEDGVHERSRPRPPPAFRQPPPPPPPPPSVATAPSVVGGGGGSRYHRGYGARDAAGLDCDTDSESDARSLPPAYDEGDAASYVHLVEASSVVADGFQYRAGEPRP